MKKLDIGQVYCNQIILYQSSVIFVNFVSYQKHLKVRSRTVLNASTF